MVQLLSCLGMRDTKPILLTIILSACRVLPVLSSWEWTAATKQGLYLPSQFGVHNFKLGGHIELNDGKQLLIDAVVYAKLLRQGDFIRVRAQVWFLEVKPDEPHQDEFTYYVRSSPKLMNVTRFPKLKIRPVRTGQWNDDTCDYYSCLKLHPQTLHSVSPYVKAGNSTAEDPLTNFKEVAPSSRSPYMLPVVYYGETEFTSVQHSGRLNSHPAYYLCMENSLQCGHFPIDQAAELTERVMFDSPRPTFVSVYKPFFGIPAIKAATLMYYNIKFHQELGFSGAVAYERGSYYHSLMENVFARELVQSGALSLIAWTPETSSFYVPATSHDLHSNWNLWDQPMLYSHAALMFWGTNTYLLYNDYDEFLVMPQGMTVFNLMAPTGCLQGLSYMEIERKNYDTAVDLDRSPIPLFDSVPPAALKRYRSYNLPFPDKELHKVLTFADALYGYEVHFGYVFQAYNASSVIVPQDCLSMVHLHTLVGRSKWLKDTLRPNKDANTSWQWPFDKLESLEEGISQH